MTQKATATTPPSARFDIGGGGLAVGHATVNGGTEWLHRAGSTVTVTDGSVQVLGLRPQASDVLIATGNSSPAAATPTPRPT